MAKDKITTKDRKKATNDMGPTRVSEDSCEEQAGLDASEGENRTRGQGNGNTTLRQRHRASKPRVPDLVAAQGNPSISGERSLEQRQEDSFLSEIGNDIWSLVRAIPRLLRTSYPVWKRLLLFYGLWLITSHLAAQFVSDITTKMAPMCSVPIIGPRIPFCTWSLEPNDRSFDVSQVATSQEVFTVVMDQVGQNFDLARGMTGNQFTLQHLRIRVDASNLPRKKELAQELAHLIRLTKQTAKGMSQFTAKVGKSTDKVNALNDYAVKNLEGIAEQRQNPPTLPNRMLLAISPFAAFRPPNADDSEEQVKKIVIDTANGIADKVKVLQSASFDITHSLDTIQSTLDRIQELAVDEIGTQPRMDVLGALWARLAHPDDYKEHKSHSSLLTDMTSFYESASYVMQETTASLNGVEANLDEFYDDLSTPGLTLRDQPLEIIVAQFKGSSRRLEASKEKLELIEGGERPRGDDVKKVVTKTVAVTSA